MIVLSVLLNSVTVTVCVFQSISGDIAYKEYEMLERVRRLQLDTRRNTIAIVVTVGQHHRPCSIIARLTIRHCRRR